MNVSENGKEPEIEVQQYNRHNWMKNLKKEVTYQAIDSLVIAIRCCNMEEIQKYLNDYDPIIVNRLESQTRQPCLYFSSVLTDHEESYQIMKILIQHGANPHFKDGFQQTVLFYVCREGKEKCLDLLLENGLNLNDTDLYGQTPVYYAAKENRLNIIHKIIEKGADLNVRDLIIGQTPLFYAAKEGHLEMCKILVQNGCDLSIQDSNNKLAAYLAKKHNHFLLYDYLNAEFQILKEKRNALPPPVGDNNEQTNNEEIRNTKKIIKKKKEPVVHRPQKNGAKLGQNQQTAQSSQPPQPAPAPVPVPTPTPQPQIKIQHEPPKMPDQKKVVQPLKSPQTPQASPPPPPPQSQLSPSFPSSQPSQTSQPPSVSQPSQPPHTSHHSKISEAVAAEQTVLSSPESTQPYRLYRADSLGNICELTIEEVESLIDEYPAIKEMYNIWKEAKEVKIEETTEIMDYETWSKLAFKVLAACCKAKGANFFLEPVDPQKYGVDDYFDIIKQPMDFGTIREKLNNSEYNNLESFKKDMNLVFDNCVEYNGPENAIAKHSIEIKGIFQTNMRLLGLMK